MSTEQIKAVARRFYEEAMNGKNLNLLDELFATNYQAHPPGVAEPLTREAFKQFNRLFLIAFPDLHITVEDEIAEEDKAALRMSVQGTHLGAFMDIPPTGKQVRWTGMSITRVANGKIVEQWGEQDLLGVLQQLGVIPAPEPAGLPPALNSTRGGHR
jgi:predicted ester cyclase